MDEFGFIEYLKKKVPCGKRVLLGIGDDAAVVDVARDKRLVVSTDVIVEDVDFKLSELAPEKIGRKALAVNLSDIAAMGASPTAFVISIGKPVHLTPVWLKRFYQGLLTLAKRYGVTCAGGDLSRSREFFANVTIFGEASEHHFVKRSGASAGDWIAVTGTLGGSLLRHHYDFTPRVREGAFVAGHVTPTAMIDLSDGLLQDLGHILRASGAGASLEIDRIPVSRDAVKMSAGNMKKARSRALIDGEDFELLFTVPPWQKMMLEKGWKKAFPRVPLTWIGRIEGQKPVVRWTRNGREVTGPKLSRKGFIHF